MKRREFLTATGAMGLVALSAKIGMGNDPPASHKAVSLRQVETDHFVLEFAPDTPRAFRILQLTDTHFGNPEPAYQERDRRTFELITQLVAQQRPDFIVHTGDFINNDRGRRVSFEATEFMDSLGLPWTHALGNHDIGAMPIEEYRQRLRGAAFGYFDAEGSREYAFRLDVLPRGGEKPAWSIFCFDSGFRMPNKHVSEGQLAWFGRQRAADRRRELDCPALAMIHIPTVEFEKLRATQQFRGIFGERVCFESDTGKTFDALAGSGRIHAVFSGHDHANDYCGVFGGIELVYGRVSGWSGYGDLQRGGRLIELSLDGPTYRHQIVLPQA
jgi:predicted phosphodiesterase